MDEEIPIVQLRILSPGCWIAALLALVIPLDCCVMSCVTGAIFAGSLACGWPIRLWLPLPWSFFPYAGI